MAFPVQNQSQDDNANSGKTVDFNELNQYVVDTANVQDREILVGYVSMIVDLGTQEQEDASVPFTGSEEEERKIIAEKPDTYFKDVYDYEKRENVYCKCWPQKPVQCVAFAVDFPDIMVDKGQFFGESKPLPLRLWMGGQFYIPDVGMIVGRPTPLKYTNLDKTRKTKVWSLAQNSLPYKMAVASKIVKPGEAFLPERVDELLGQAFQFEIQVFFKESKGKSYYTEYIKFNGGLGRGQSAPEQLTEPMMVTFVGDNKPEAVKELRAHVVNTIKRASNYDGSKLKEQIESVRNKPAPKDADEGEDQKSEPEAKADKPTKPTRKPAAKKEDKPAQPASDTDDFDDDIPF